MLRTLRLCSLLLCCTQVFAATTIEVDLQGSVEGGWPSELSGKSVSIDASLVNHTDYQTWTFNFYFQPDNWPSPNQDETNMVCDVGDEIEAAVFAADLDKQVLTGSNGNKFAVWVKSNAVNIHSVTASEVNQTINLPLNVTLKTREEEPSGTDPSPAGGDANSDGDVDFFDLDTVLSNFGMQNASWSDGDFDGDGDVDFADYLTASANYQSW